MSASSNGKLSKIKDMIFLTSSSKEKFIIYNYVGQLAKFGWKLCDTCIRNSMIHRNRTDDHLVIKERIMIL